MHSAKRTNSLATKYIFKELFKAFFKKFYLLFFSNFALVEKLRARKSFSQST